MKFFIDKSNDRYTYQQILEVPESRMPAGVYKPKYLSGNPDMPYFQPLKSQNDNPIVLNDSHTSLCNEIDTFFKNKDRYDNFGFAHKRGYILYGPAGCGKSSMLRLLQNQFIKDFDGIVLFQTASFNVERHLEEIRKYEPDRKVMAVCEDIDTYIASFETGLLEFLDGQERLTNFVLVATTNYLEVIPDRIKFRPSRIDRLVEIGLPTESDRFIYLSSLPNVKTEDAKEMSKISEGLGIAALKELVIAKYCLDLKLKDVVKNLKKIADGEFEEKTKPKKKNLFGRPLLNRFDEDEEDEDY